MMNKMNSSRRTIFFSGLVLLIIGCFSLLGFQGTGKFNSYTQTIPGSDKSFDMVAIPGGTFLMGSPESEKGREKDEGPVHTVKVDPFWMGKHEITWDEYELFVYPKNNIASGDKTEVDGFSSPTPPYVDMSFGMGKNGFPAINMTQYAALNYCLWLTAKTGDFYRLPTEAEWEYACRAGSKTAYHFGNDPSELSEYGWYYENSNGGYKKGGLKKPNQWGLYDMHGNVAEWTLDQYLPQYKATGGKVQVNPIVEPTKLYPHVVRGGSWDDDPEDLRSAARMASSPAWKQRDPQIPKSNWWMTNASFVGFRIVRPLEQPSPEEIREYFEEPIQDF
jgi:formylglycine-generating enzyme required for sulfatase activity